jgi:RRXRR protein
MGRNETGLVTVVQGLKNTAPLFNLSEGSPQGSSTLRRHRPLWSNPRMPTGLALTRFAKEDPQQTTLHLAELTHRGDDIRARNKKRAGYHRRRRNSNLRHPAPRFN